MPPKEEAIMNRVLREVISPLKTTFQRFVLGNGKTDVNRTADVVKELYAKWKIIHAEYERTGLHAKTKTDPADLFFYIVARSLFKSHKSANCVPLWSADTWKTILDPLRVDVESKNDKKKEPYVNMFLDAEDEKTAVKQMTGFLNNARDWAMVKAFDLNTQHLKFEGLLTLKMKFDKAEEKVKKVQDPEIKKVLQKTLKDLKTKGEGDDISLLGVHVDVLYSFVQHLEGRTDAMEQIVAQLVKDVSSAAEKVEIVGAKVQAVDTTVKNMGLTVKSVQQEVKAVRSKTTDMQQMVDFLFGQDQAKSCQIDDLQKQGKRHEKQLEDHSKLQDGFVREHSQHNRRLNDLEYSHGGLGTRQDQLEWTVKELDDKVKQLQKTQTKSLQVELHVEKEVKKQLAELVVPALMDQHIANLEKRLADLEETVSSLDEVLMSRVDAVVQNSVDKVVKDRVKAMRVGEAVKDGMEACCAEANARDAVLVAELETQEERNEFSAMQHKLHGDITIQVDEIQITALELKITERVKQALADKIEEAKMYSRGLAQKIAAEKNQRFSLENTLQKIGEDVTNMMKKVVALEDEVEFPMGSFKDANEE